MSLWRVEVVILPKDGVSDPQGEAVKGGLLALGHSGVSRVRVGRHIEVDIDAGSEADASTQVTIMAQQLLANPVIEQFHIESVTLVTAVGVN